MDWCADLKVGIVYHEDFCQYDLGEGHPFRGDRFISAIEFFEREGLFNSTNVIILEPRQVAKQDLLAVHDEEYVNLIYRLAETSQPYDLETPVSPRILEAALLIAGGAVEAGRAICEGKVHRAVSLGGGFHHAGRNYGGGFCLFNDVAVLVERLRKEHGLKRVLILDYDVHFGNGTSDIYHQDPDVLFISLHQDPRTIYPGIGFVEEIGKGAGEGYNINVPLPPGTGDQTYLHALKDIFLPLAEEFEPELIIANGGSDAHFADALGNLRLTVNGFFALSHTIVEVAEKVCKGRLILMPGSGYNPTVLPLCWYALAAGVAGLEKIGVREPYPPPEEPSWVRQIVEGTLQNLRRILQRYWRCFK